MTNAPGARHVVIVGAARSGTKILRDTLAAATGGGVVPYDIGFVWRVGQSPPDDVLDPATATPRRRRFITGYLERYAAGEPRAVIEKTVGNTLRVPFVSAVLPGAAYVHLLRDGVDVAESTMRQWSAPADARYLRDKVRHFPLRLAPTYGRAYALSLLRRRLKADARVASWGPRYPGIDRDLRDAGLLTVCARQWRASVTTARRDFADLGLPVLEVRYEDLVARPAAVLSDVADFCDLPSDVGSLEAASRRIVPGRSGVGAASLEASELSALDTEIGDLLEELGYDRPLSRTQRRAGRDD